MRGIPQSSLGKYLATGGSLRGLGNTIIGYDDFGDPITDDGLAPSDGSGVVDTGQTQAAPTDPNSLASWLASVNQIISTYTGVQVALSQADAQAKLAQINAQRSAQGLQPIIPGQGVPLSPMAKAGIGLAAGALLLSAFFGKKRR